MLKYRPLKFTVLTFLALMPALGFMYIVVYHQQQVDPFLRIINLLGTLMHEGGHAIATFLTRGHLHELVVNPDGSGHILRSGGNDFWILPAGYLTCSMFTAIMFLINNKTRWGEVIPLLMGVAAIALTLVYGAKLAGGITTIIVGLVCGFFLLYIGIHAEHRIPFTNRKFGLPDWAWMSIVNIISMYYGLGGILSLESLSRYAERGNSDDISRFAVEYFPATHPTQVAATLMWLSIGVWVIVFIICLYGYFKKKEQK